MHLHFEDVNDAFLGIVKGFHTGRFKDKNYDKYDDNDRHVQMPPISKTTSRYGDVMVIEEPVTITYTEPLQRLLFNQVRNCNPFFHLIEALWMLLGGVNIVGLSHFNRKVMEFADADLYEGQIPGREDWTGEIAGTSWWGAYGYRWRKWFGHDQLERCIRILRNQRNCRRVILTMWDPRDLERVENKPDCKDVPCNTQVLFMPRVTKETSRLLRSQKPRARKGAGAGSPDDLQNDSVPILDMTVINRSNDMLWGALGSNYVHFSFLLEYVALSAGYAPGKYHQVSNNLHVYVQHNSDAALEGIRTGRTAENTLPKEGVWSGQWTPTELLSDTLNPYMSGDLYNHYPLFSAPFNDSDAITANKRQFDEGVRLLFESDADLLKADTTQRFAIPEPHPTKDTPHPDVSSGRGLFPWPNFFHDLVIPAVCAWNKHKRRQYEEAADYAGRIRPTDWRMACEQWLDRTEARWLRSKDDGVHQRYTK